MRTLKICLLSSIIPVLGGCRTTDSSVKAEQEMSKEEFLETCQQMLKDPSEGAIVAMSLQAFAEAKNCDEAYEKIKAIVAKTKG